VALSPPPNVKQEFESRYNAKQMMTKHKGVVEYRFNVAYTVWEERG